MPPMSTPTLSIATVRPVQNSLPRQATPPSTVRIVPDTNLARSEAANTIMSATSFGSAARPKGNGLTSARQFQVSVRSSALRCIRWTSLSVGVGTRIDAENAHAVVRAHRAERVREPHQPGIADRPDDDFRIGSLAAIADHVDDDAAPPRAHRHVEFAGQVHGCDDLEVEAFRASRHR